HLVVIGFRVVLTGIHRQNGVDEFRSPAVAAAGHLPDANHVGLTREDIDLHRPVSGDDGRYRPDRGQEDRLRDYDTATLHIHGDDFGNRVDRRSMTSSSSYSNRPWPEPGESLENQHFIRHWSAK